MNNKQILQKYKENKEKQDFTKWLNSPISDTLIIFDIILDIKDDIVKDILNNKLTLKYDENVLLMNIAYFLYYNSYTNNMSLF